ncbi:hypothetical protein Trydic_g5864 [Trypoxylus dichotomus]
MHPRSFPHSKSSNLHINETPDVNYEIEDHPNHPFGPRVGQRRRKRMAFTITSSQVSYSPRRGVKRSYDKKTAERHTKETYRPSLALYSLSVYRVKASRII